MSFLPYGDSGPLGWSLATGGSLVLHVAAIAGLTYAMQSFVQSMTQPEVRPTFVISIEPLNSEAVTVLPPDIPDDPTPNDPEPVPIPEDLPVTEPDPVQESDDATVESTPETPTQSGVDEAEAVPPSTGADVDTVETPDPVDPDLPEATAALSDSAPLEPEQTDPLLPSVPEPQVAEDAPQQIPEPQVATNTEADEATVVAPPDVPTLETAGDPPPAIAPLAGPALEPEETGPLLDGGSGVGIAAPVDGVTTLPGSAEIEAPPSGDAPAEPTAPVVGTDPVVSSGPETPPVPQPEELALVTPPPSVPQAPRVADDPTPAVQSPPPEAEIVGPDAVVEGREVPPPRQLSPRDQALAALIKRIRDANATTDPCLLTLPRRSGEDGIGLAMLAAEDAVMAGFSNELLTEPEDAEIVQTRTLVDPRQCPALDYVRQNQDYPASRLGMRLDTSEVASGRALSGVLSGVEGRNFLLLLVDNNGVVQDLSRFASVSGNFARFEVPMTRVGPLRDTVQMVIALASRQSLAPIAERSGQLSQDVFTGLPTELTEEAALGVVSFRMR